MPISRREFLQAAAAAGGLTALGAHRAAALPRVLSGTSRNAYLSAPVDTFVVVMMENRSFDHYLGWLPGATGQQADLSYLDDSGVSHSTHSLAPDYAGCGSVDPDHSWSGGRTQLAPDASGKPGGFRKGRNVDDFSIGYYGPDDLPVWKALTTDATIFDHYFVSVLGPTYPNREYMHAATSGGRQSNTFPSDPYNGFGDPTIWDRLDAAGVSWGYYYSNLPVIGLYGARLLARPEVRHISAYYADAATGRLPHVSFIDPFFVLPQGLANDDHPHADVRLGQQFLSDVIRAFTTSSQWSSGALFLNYDEWGGFFDTVTPPVVVDATPGEGWGQLGFRCPCAVISPYARRGHIASAPYEHTSILRFIESRFGLPPLTARDANATNIGDALDFVSAPRLEPPDIPAYTAPPEARIPCELRGHAVEPNPLYEIATSGLAETVGTRVDWAFEHSYRSF